MFLSIVFAAVSAIVSIKAYTYKPSVWRVAAASGVFHVGQAFGSIIPSMFFMESYREEWISRGQTPEAMDEMISYTTGFMGIVSTAVVFLLAVVGVYIGYFILRKHFEHANVRNAA